MERFLIYLIRSSNTANVVNYTKSENTIIQHTTKNKKEFPRDNLNTMCKYIHVQ